MPTCPRCREENPDRARFCLACATPLDVGAPPRRKLATLLFCDMSGSTAIGERIDAESVREMMFAYFHEMRDAIERHGGTVEKFIGDAVMAVFGVPTAREDDAFRAVRAASEMRERLHALNDELGRRFGVRIALRIGVNTGEVVAGDSTSRQALVTGDAVNVAARLEQAASPGEILLGERTYQLVRDAVSVEPPAMLAVKGKTEPVPTYRLRGVLRDAPVRGSRLLRAPLVGREAELAMLRDLLATVVSDRRCVLVTIVGEPGVGKSRLAGELLRTVGSDVQVFSGRCLSYGEGITYWPVGEIIKQAAGIHDEHSKEEARRRIALLAPQERGSIIAVRAAQAIGLAEGQAAADEIAWAIRKVFEAIARRGPLLLVIDDVHWAEDALLDLLDLLPMMVQEAPILLLCLARRELLEERSDWEPTVRLEPLVEAESSRLVEHLLGETGLPEHVRERIVQVAQGNPLFLEELIAMLIADGVLERRGRSWVATRDVSALSIPPTLMQLLSARLDRLPEPERSALERGAIEGEIFHRGGVIELSPEPERHELPGRLRTLVEKEFIRPAKASFVDEAAYRFRHILLRDAAYNGTPKGVRAELHERFADWLEAIHGPRASEVEEVIGYHLEQAHRFSRELGRVDGRGRSLASRAARHLAAGGLRAFDRADMRAASSLLSRASELLAVDDRLRLEIAPEFAEALNFCGELERGFEVLGDCIEVARMLGDRELELTALVERELTRFWSEREPPNTEGAIRIADQAVEVFERRGDDLRLARTFQLAASAYFWACRFEAGSAVLERGLDHARRSGGRKVRSQIMAWSARALALGPVPVEVAIPRCEEMLTEAAGLGWLAEGGVHEGYVWLLAMAGRFDEAREGYTSTIAHEEEVGAMWPLTVIRRSAGNVEMLAGDWTAAERHLRWSFDRLPAMGEKGQLATVAGLLGDVLYRQERYEEAEALTEVAERASSDSDIDAQVRWRRSRGKLLARRGDLTDAIRLGEEAVSMARQTDALNLQGDALLDSAEVLRVASQVHEAAAVTREGLRAYEKKGNLASAARARSLLDDLQGPGRPAGLNAS